MEVRRTNCWRRSGGPSVPETQSRTLYSSPSFNHQSPHEKENFRCVTNHSRQQKSLKTPSLTDINR